jgi:hypothetical protein
LLPAWREMMRAPNIRFTPQVGKSHYGNATQVTGAAGISGTDTGADGACRPERKMKC